MTIEGVGKSDYCFKSALTSDIKNETSGNIDVLGTSGKIIDDSKTTQSDEHFKDVFDEMSANIPDRTTTVEQKKRAIAYIDRMLACKDIPSDMQTYWQYKKSEIEQEILRMRNA